MTATATIHRTVVSRLTPVPPLQRAAFRALPPDLAGHANALAAVPAFRQVEVGGITPPPFDRPAVRLAAWNLERGLFPEESARILARARTDLALLTELDIGLLRTGQVHTVGRMAALLGQGYAYGLEFLELAAMPPPAGFPMNGVANSEGFHGNGFISALPFAAPVAIRLPEVADWFNNAPAGLERRIGTRVAVAATFSAAATRFVACSAHLESLGGGAGRATQMAALLDALDDYAAGLPIVIGGDLNTVVPPGQRDAAAEPLFAVAEARGYDFGAANAAGPTTRTSAWSSHPGDRQLDWFCVRGLRVRDPRIVPAIGEDAEILSDHEMICLTLDLS